MSNFNRIVTAEYHINRVGLRDASKETQSAALRDHAIVSIILFNRCNPTNQPTNHSTLKG